MKHTIGLRYAENMNNKRENAFFQFGNIKIYTCEFSLFKYTIQSNNMDNIRTISGLQTQKQTHTVNGKSCCSASFEVKHSQHVLCTMCNSQSYSAKICPQSWFNM